MRNLIKLILLSILIICQNISFFYSQITIDQNDFGSSGDHTYISLIDPGSLNNFALTGPNYNWDFSSVNYIFQDSIFNESVSQTPIAYQLYFNNPFFYPLHQADYARLSSDVTVIPTLQITDRFDFYKKNNSELAKVGFGATINGIPSSIRYDTIEKILSFPLDYPCQDSSRGYYLANIPTLGTYGQWIRRNYEVDGWGVLSTPFHTYDVLRLKSTIMQKDTVYIDQFQFGTSFNQPELIVYQWLAKGYDFPVMTVVIQAGSIVEGWYIDDLHVSVVEQDLIDFSIYPNPTKNIVYLEGLSIAKSSLVELLDVSGNQLNKCSGCKSFDVSDYPAGVYFIKLKQGLEVKYSKFLKI